MTDDDIPEVLAAAEHIETLLKPHAETPSPTPIRVYHVNWRETELGMFEEEALREFYKHAR